MLNCFVKFCSFVRFFLLTSRYFLQIRKDESKCITFYYLYSYVATTFPRFSFALRLEFLYSIMWCQDPCRARPCALVDDVARSAECLQQVLNTGLFLLESEAVG